MSWVLLAGAIVSEVVATLSLKVVSDGGTWRWYLLTGAGYAAAFALLTAVLCGRAFRSVSPTACGPPVTAGVSHLVFGEPLTRRMLAGIMLIMAGVLMVEVGRIH